MTANKGQTVKRVKLQILAAIALTIGAIVAFSISVRAGNLQIEHIHAPASIGAAKTGAAYFAIINDTNSAKRLISAATTAARKAELHNHLMEDGVMKMRKVEALDIPAGGRVMLKPGGYHLMMFGLRQPLKEGASFELQLTFERAGVMTLKVPVKSRDHKPMDHSSSQ